MRNETERLWNDARMQVSAQNEKESRADARKAKSRRRVTAAKVRWSKIFVYALASLFLAALVIVAVLYVSTFGKAGLM